MNADVLSANGNDTGRADRAGPQGAFPECADCRTQLPVTEEELKLSSMLTPQPSSEDDNDQEASSLADGDKGVSSGGARAAGGDGEAGAAAGGGIRMREGLRKGRRGRVAAAVRLVWGRGKVGQVQKRRENG